MSNEYSRRVLELARADLVEIHCSDVDGRSLSLPVPGRQIISAVKDNAGIDGSSIKGFGREVNESDMWLRPDLSTALVFPWKNSNGRTLGRVVADVLDADGTSFEGDPRRILRKQIERAAGMGYNFVLSPEIEFFVFPRDEKGDPVAASESNGYYYLHQSGKVPDVRTEMMLKLQAVGLDVEAAHPEVAHNQHEINFACAGALSQADNVVLFRDVVKAVAAEQGCHATFMAKPVAGVNGSGMHTNMSLSGAEDGKNLFYDEGAPDKLSVLAKQFIAGILEHINAITAVANPTVNSYRRIIPGFEAPVNIAWGPSNRSVLIRVPKAKVPDATRIELRSPDPMCNPYLAFAVMLAAGLDGIEKKLDPPPPTKEDIFDLPPQKLVEMGIGHLPTSLRNALEFLEKDKVIRDALGEHTYAAFRDAKLREWGEYKQHVSEWERDRYLAFY
ncbi:MAG: type I glutamate--ammonia ligase [Candidatus Gracilibacteria bacterium]